mgnify:CR=1 FL=1
MNFFFHTLLPWIRSNTILFLASLGALLSFWAVPPSRALVGALNLPVLALLFCLMGVIGGLRETGFFDRLPGNWGRCWCLPAFSAACGSPTTWP